MLRHGYELLLVFLRNCYQSILKTTFDEERMFQVFHEVAYKAHNRDHLIAGLDEFLDLVSLKMPLQWKQDEGLSERKIIDSSFSE